MLRTFRRIAGLLCFTLITLLFLDFTGTLHVWLGGLAKIQFLPAVLALNAGVILFLVVLTLLFGRIYCSVICPLGVFQDLVSWVAGKRKKRRFTYSPAITWLRYTMVALLIVAFVAGISSVVSILEPYSAYGRIASNLFAPVWLWGNNLLAQLAERMNSYRFYEVDIWMKSLPVFVLAVVTFLGVAVLAWRHGRTYCNTICPVGTVLGLLSRFSLFKPVISGEKCNQCGLCTRICKASCINYKAKEIDYSRCVTCMNCLNVCKKGAIHYAWRSGVQAKEVPVNPVAAALGKKDNASLQAGRAELKPTVPLSSEIHSSGTDRRGFLSIGALFVATAALKGQEKKVDGGLAVIEDKKIPNREWAPVPPGAQSYRNFTRRCTACQLCVSACPNQILRPSSNLSNWMQPEMSYERGYCRPECTKCSEVCPAGAIRPVTVAEKSSIQIGHAVWVKKNCVVLTDLVACGNCARHCPTEAIQMVASEPGNAESLKIPAVNIERCIGCGACENLCPSRPFSAIYVEGHRSHRII